LFFTTPAGLAVSRSGRPQVPANLFLEDLAHRRALLVAADLALGCVLVRAREPRGGAKLLRDGAYPLGDLLHAGSGGDRLAPLEVDQLAGEAVSDRAPQVLLEQPVWERRQRLALVERARDPRGQRVTESRERSRLRKVRLRVADPDLDGREREVRPHAPPDLRVLGDRAGLVEEADVRLPLLPAGERVGD